MAAFSDFRHEKWRNYIANVILTHLGKDVPKPAYQSVVFCLVGYGGVVSPLDYLEVGYPTDEKASQRKLA